MRKIIVFNHISLDGYFVDRNGQMNWAHSAADNQEWNAFVSENASGSAVFLFGRVTYDLMAGFWPTPMAHQNMPDVAESMNNSQKLVFSRTLDKVTWQNAKLVKGDLITEVRKLKQGSGENFLIFGSGTIVTQLAEAGLIDEYQLVVNPIALGAGRTMFDGLKINLRLKLSKSRAFSNGNVVLWYVPVD